ncbi:hypothetical protein RI129_010855 [Pyrocoelia pectoralis]|uniref:Uncharacterized protein n=1 Tax=Pyrocoelia pectoralis TaxID=417401 RepID=A0AAN7V535_9COLE
MNDLLTIKQRPINTYTYSFGLSTLHAYIRFFECLLHISYRLEIKHWQIRGEQNKAKMALKKQEVIDQFRRKMGLLVDMPKQGFGNTNDGNTARRFFENTALSSEITGIDERLIKRFSNILCALFCGYALNEEGFDSYAMETASLYVQLYGWYFMPTSVHKILVHGASVMRSLLLPIEVRWYREHSTMKMSRKCTNTDLIHILLISSDPLISSIRPLPVKKPTKLDTEVYSLLKIPDESICITKRTQFSQDTDSDSEINSD